VEGAVQCVEVVGTGQGPHPAAPEGFQRQGHPPSLWVWQPKVANSTTFQHLCLWGSCWHPVQGGHLTAVFAHAISSPSSRPTRIASKHLLSRLSTRGVGSFRQVSWLGLSGIASGASAPPNSCGLRSWVLGVLAFADVDRTC
jgi:hypothetical protein